MHLNVTAKVHPKISALFKELGPEWRRSLYGVGANALKIGLKKYLRREADRRHFTANRLGGTPTGHIKKGAARITALSSDKDAIVLVPIAGITRAFKDLTITPKRASALTIPLSGAAYGHTVRELKRMKWTIFRPKGHDYLMGTHEGGEATLLYSLRKKVIVRKDRSLLPQDEEITDTINRAVVKAVKHNLDKLA